MLYRILLFGYLISLCYYDDKVCNVCAIIFCLLFLFKLVFNKRSCSISYIECKLRGIKKEKGFVFNALEEIYDLNKSKYSLYVYLFIILVLLINLKKIIYN